MNELHDVFQERDIFVRKLKTSGMAYHSHHMKALGSWYQTMLESVWHPPSGFFNGFTNDTFSGCKPSSIRMISTVTGITAIPAQTRSPGYWNQNLESPVRFENAVWVLSEGERCHFVEVGSHSSLELPIKQTATLMYMVKDHYLYSSLLIRNKDAAVTTLTLVGGLSCTAMMSSHSRI